MRGHKVDGFDGTQRTTVIYTTIAHDANGTDRQEDGKRLTDFVGADPLRSSSMKIASRDAAGRSTLSSLRPVRARRGPRPRERMAIQHVVRQAQLQTNLTHFVFEQLFQRFNQPLSSSLRQAADIVVNLMTCALPVAGAADSITSG